MGWKSIIRHVNKWPKDPGMKSLAFGMNKVLSLTTFLHKGTSVTMRAQALDLIIKTVLGFYPDVEAIYLFGSYQTAYEAAESDVDMALLFSPERAKELGNLSISECRKTLEDILKRTVDLINIRMVNTVFQNGIVGEGRAIFTQNEHAADEFEMLVLSYYQKLNEERAEILKDILDTGRILK